MEGPSGIYFDEGQGDKITTSSSAVHVDAGATFDVYGSNDTITAGAKANYGVWGDNNTVNAGGSNGVWIGGHGDTIAMIGGHIYAADGTTFTSEGAGDAISCGANNTITLGWAHTVIPSRGDNNLIFNSNPGTAIIKGFYIKSPYENQHYYGSDNLQISHTLFADMAHLLAATSQQGADTVIRVDANNSITLVGVAMSSLMSGHVSLI